MFYLPSLDMGMRYFTRDIATHIYANMKKWPLINHTDLQDSAIWNCFGHDIARETKYIHVFSDKVKS